MLEFSGQLLMESQMLGEKASIDSVDAFTRLKLDTISLCGFYYWFNSFYQNEMHPFVKPAFDALVESCGRAGRSALEKRVRVWLPQKYDEHTQSCCKAVTEVDMAFHYTGTVYQPSTHSKRGLLFSEYPL